MSKIISIKDSKSPIAEAYREIRTNIEFSNIDSEKKVILTTSSRANEGKSTVLSNLAVTFANLDKKVLIIDGDLRNPTIHKTFGLSNIYGLTDILLEKLNFMECVQPSGITDLHILACGDIPPNPSEMLASNKMKTFLEIIRERYDYIFIDAPPIGVVTDAGIISGYSDGVIFVVESNGADIEQIKMAKERLLNINAKILGVVLNKFDNKKSGYDYYNYYYQQDEASKKGRKERKKDKKKAGRKSWR